MSKTSEFVQISMPHVPAGPADVDETRAEIQEFLDTAETVIQSAGEEISTANQEMLDEIMTGHGPLADETRLERARAAAVSADRVEMTQTSDNPIQAQMMTGGKNKWMSKKNGRPKFWQWALAAPAATPLTA